MCQLWSGKVHLWKKNENDIKLALSNKHLVWNRYPNGKLILFLLKVWGTFPYSVEISTINGEK